MKQVVSACGVLCSGCGAYHASDKGLSNQQRVAAAWHRIYRLNDGPEAISCAGCGAPDDQVFHTCRKCKARQCCRKHGFATCAECPVEKCSLLEKAQSVWDGVPKIAKKLSQDDFLAYAEPYLHPRERIAEMRRAPNKE